MEIQNFISKKKILVVCPAPIYPIEMGSQVRFFFLVKRLSKDHSVDVIAKVPSRAYFTSIFFDKVKETCNDYYPVLTPNKKSNLARIYYKMKYKFNSGIMTIPNLLFYNSIPALEQKIAQIANSKRYDIINCEYWYSCNFLKRLSYRPYLALDTHNVNFEKFEKTLKLKKEFIGDSKKLKKFKAFELEYTSLNDLIISISEHDFRTFKSYFPHKTHIKIPTGQELSKYLNYKPKLISKSILFYGNMSKESIQNVDAFWTLFYKIYPFIKKRVKDCKLFVVGANPPEEIKRLHNKEIIITGFIEYVNEVISQASVLILPLKSGGGFRTRVVEVMALGVPVIGTHLALDNIELEHGVHGYVTDRTDEMAEYAIGLLEDANLREKMGEACKNFVSKIYSIDATYGRLSQYYLELPMNTEFET